MKIQVLGPGCANCAALERRVRDSLDRLGMADAQVDKVTDYAQIAAMGVMSTPGLAVDGVVVSSGRVPEPDEVDELLAR